MQTQDQLNAYARNRYLRPGIKEKANAASRLRYLKNHPDKAECKPDYGIAFKGDEVQKKLKKWGG